MYRIPFTAKVIFTRGPFSGMLNKIVSHFSHEGELIIDIHGMPAGDA